MEILVSNKEGRIWCLSSGNPGYFYYTHKSLNIDALTDADALDNIIRITKLKHERRVATKYTLSYSSDILKQLTTGNFTDAFLQSIATWGPYETLPTPVLTDNDRLTMMADLLTTARNGVNVTNFEIRTESVNQTEGYQIRCVKE